MITAATTVTAAGTVSQIRFRRNAAQFECLGKVLMNGMLYHMKFLPRPEKTLRNWILQKLIPVFFKIGDFDFIRLNSPSLFFLKRLTFAHDGFKLEACIGIG